MGSQPPDLQRSGRFGGGRFSHVQNKVLVGVASAVLVVAVVMLFTSGDGGNPSAGEVARRAAMQDGPDRTSYASSMAIDALRGDGLSGDPGGDGDRPAQDSISASPPPASNPDPGPGDGDPVVPPPPPPDEVVDDVCTEAERAEIAATAEGSRSDLEAELEALEAELEALDPALTALIESLEEEIRLVEEELASLDELEEEALAVCEAGGDGLGVLS